MFPLVPGEPKAPLFKNGIAPIPAPQREAIFLRAVGDPADAVFSPAVGAGTRVVVRKKFPGCAAGAVILADRSPLPLREIGPPTLPMLLADARLFEPVVFSRLDSWHRRMALAKSFRL